MSTCKILQLQVKVYNKFTFFVLYYSAYLCNRICAECGKTSLNFPIWGV